MTSLLSAKPIEPQDRLIVALDVPDANAARALVTELGDAVVFYKIGLELFMTSGYFDLLHWLVGQGKKVFVDLKFFDVPETVRSAVRALAGIDTAGVVCYLGTFSKVMYPSLRVGYVVAPEWLVDAMVGLRWHMDFQPPTLESAALAEFIEEGHFERHLREKFHCIGERFITFAIEILKISGRGWIATAHS